MSKEQYVKESMKRIEEFAKHGGEEIGVMTKAAINAELKTMFEAGFEDKTRTT